MITTLRDFISLQWRRNFCGTIFNFSVPLKNLLEFAEDYKKVLLNCKLELVLMLTKNLGDVFEQTRNEQTFKLEMTKITWKIPHVTPSNL